MSTADISQDPQSLHGLLPPTNDDIEAIIQLATSGEGKSGPLKDTRTQLFVGNLPYRVRWQDLKDLFRKAGTVLRADVSLGPDNRSRGYGTVLLATAEDAGRAIDMFNGYSWQTRVLEVRPDRMGSDVDQQSHYEHLNQTNNLRASSAMLGVPSLFVGGGVAGGGGDLDYASLLGLDNRPPSSSGPSNGGGGGRNLFVGNLPFHCQWQDLKDLFRRAGTILRADVALGQDGRSRGFGTVVFATEADAERALRMFNGHELNGRPLKVHYDKFSQTAQPTILPISSLSPNLSSLTTSLSTPASPTPQQQHQKMIPPHLSHLLSTSHLGNTLLSSAATSRSLSSGTASPRHINSYPSSRPLSPQPPSLSNLSASQHQDHSSNQIVMPAGYTLDFGPSSRPTTPYYEALSAAGYLGGSNAATDSNTDWPPRSGAQSAASSRDGDLTVASLAERIVGKGLGGLSIGDARESTGLQRPSLLSRSEPVSSAALALSPALSSGSDAMSRLLTRRSSVTNSAISIDSGSGSAGSGSVIGSGRVSRTNSGGVSAGEGRSTSGSGSGDLSSARTTPLSDHGLDLPQSNESPRTSDDNGEKEKRKAKEIEKEKDAAQTHPHHPGPIAIPPPPRWGHPHPPPHAHAHAHAHAHPHPHPAYPYPGYPIPSPSAYPMPHNAAQMTPHGLPPITPSMPPFTFFNPGMGSPMPSPAIGYPVSPYAMAAGTPLHSPGIPGYHPMGIMMVTPTGIMPPPPPPPPPPSIPQHHGQTPQAEEERPGTARRPSVPEDATEEDASSSGNDVGDKGQSESGKGKDKEDDNPYFRFASVSGSQQPQQQSSAPQPQPQPQHSPLPPMPHYPHPMHMGMYHPMHAMTPFSPGLAMSPWEPNPFINAAVGAPVHHPQPPGGYFAGATPSSLGAEMGSGANAEAGIGGYFDSVYKQGSSSSGEGSKEVSPKVANDKGVSERSVGGAHRTEEPHQKRSTSYNLNLPSFGTTSVSQEKGDQRATEMIRTQSMSSSAASRPRMHRPDSDPGDRQHGHPVVVSPEE
ncbi:hypothetical protein V5O48_006758 [Marasmius crinis-equi]|uniref:RRM domain-containing protein n=1 Tax=Marasmius crinis-equi TaxID=585013 RepID=A0ABR3FIM1_9AGAR